MKLLKLLALTLLIAPACQSVAQERVSTSDHWRAIAESQIRGEAPLEPGTGMWLLTHPTEGQQRWLVVRQGDKMYMEPTLRTARGGAAFVTLPEGSVPAKREWTVQSADLSLDISFDPEFRDMQTTWRPDSGTASSLGHAIGTAIGGGNPISAAVGAISTVGRAVVDKTLHEEAVTSGMKLDWPGLPEGVRSWVTPIEKDVVPEPPQTQPEEEPVTSQEPTSFSCLPHRRPRDRR